MEEEKRQPILSAQMDLFMVLLTALNVLLSRYTGQSDICIGSPIAGRSRTELEGLIGVFVNMLVLRTDLSGDPSFLELLGRVRGVTLGAFSHQDVPFEKLVEELQPERHTSRTPLFQAMLVLQNAPSPPSRTSTLEFERNYIDIGTAKFDLTFFVYELEEGLRISIEYSTELFVESTIARMAEQLHTLLEGIVQEPEQRVSAIPLLPEEERRRLLVEWNETRSDYPCGSCVHELISAQAERSPEQAAVEVRRPTLDLCRARGALESSRPLPPGPRASVPRRWSACTWSARSRWWWACSAS